MSSEYVPPPVYGPGNDNYGRDKLDLSTANEKLEKLKELVGAIYTESEHNKAVRELLDRVIKKISKTTFGYQKGLTMIFRYDVYHVIKSIRKEYE